MAKDFKKIIEYKDKTFKTNNWLPMEDEEFLQLQNEFFSRPPIDDVKNEIIKIMSNGNVMMTTIYDYYFKDLASRTKLYHCNWTVWDVFHHKPLLEIFNEKITKNDKVFLPTESKLSKIKKALRLGGSGIAVHPSNFRLDVTLQIIKKYNINGNYYDSSCGWGVRMMGALATGVNYFGTDPNYELTERLGELSEFFRQVDLFAPNVDIRTEGSEIFKPEWVGKMGLSFTSPPYFFLEDYGIGEQSTKKFPAYRDWLEGFLRPTLSNIYQYLIEGGHLIWNIKNYKDFDLEEKTIKMAQEIGFEYLGREDYINNSRPKVNGGNVEGTEGMFVFRKGDNVHNVDYNVSINVEQYEENYLDDGSETQEIENLQEEENMSLFDEQNEVKRVPKRLFSTEQVSRYHPDKYADQISDGIVFMALRKNPKAKCAIETLVKNKTVVVSGEIGEVELLPADIERVIRNVAQHLNYEVLEIINLIDVQSSEINKAITKADNRLGAGDQGMMFGYATRETESYLPFGFHLANQVIEAIENDVPNGKLKGDAKCQVTVDLNKAPNINSVESVLVSACHEEGLDVINYVRKLLYPILGDKIGSLIVNPAGSWTLGGPLADAGVTGRKIVCDQYGGYCAVGGGAFSGKDLSKVDRSGAYTVRNIAIDILERYPELNTVEIQVAYAISEMYPVSVSVRTDKNEYDEKVLAFIEKTYDLTPSGMIDALNLKPKDYVTLAQGCHYKHGKIGGQ